jgi:ubiquinone/menaquinone biosynthesis C-methylase UbiE
MKKAPLPFCSATSLSFDRRYRVLEIFVAREGGIRRILDVGCHGGDRSLLIKIVSGAPEVFGLDWNVELLDIAQERCNIFQS